MGDPRERHQNTMPTQPETLSPSRHFMKDLTARWQSANSLVCVGLDPDPKLMPVHLVRDGQVDGESILHFNTSIIDATAEFTSAYKPQSAFYEAYGDDGLRALKSTVDYIHQKYPDIPVILDAKRGDIGSTSDAYVRAIYGEMDVDAVTLNPYLGLDGVKPFLDHADRGAIVLAKTSNKSSKEFQDRNFALTDEDLEALLNGPVRNLGRDPRFWKHRMPLSQYVAHTIANHWNINGNALLVTGATFPQELQDLRAITGDMPFLVPGIGAQGGDVAATVNAGKDSHSTGMIINSSRGIIYASRGEDFADAARKATQQLKEQINQYR